MNRNTDQTIMLLPGAFCRASIFANFRDHFAARGWTVLTPELRYHDQVPGQPADPRLAQTGLGDYVADLSALIKELSQPPVLLGHSMGGLLAQLLAAKGLARAMILLAPAPPWGMLPASENEIAAAMGLMSIGPFWGQSLNAAFEIAAENSLNCLSPARQREVFAQFVPESGQALFESLFWMFDRGRASYVNPVMVDCPILAVAGGRDKVISPAAVHNVADKYLDQATYLEFEDMGHMLLQEDGWRAVAEACTDWLERAENTAI
ncbi:MAG: alpha/beta hydrolase [Rhodospirillaceae bacterium]|jgi:pimeloyl-ACP methyl ester carboxylesterase|nr:alpha/beta hydrolase [Rhodospirillaceae bacterium]MBT3494174.1 alpha/beta hydrolase [Rhodospirillaceae bacterium]MBT3781492.1 alpha/beta hydrolase [Rhodospirillaceae bacterium]MBT3979285.1 alpha/beta hydrolase [Rhodospirillaceae bacterium]MBT4167289.1 alpha/beta hydrolase [Rhodospirillaceae bacterium]